MSEGKEGYSNLSVLGGFAAASLLSAIGIGFFTMLWMSPEGSQGPLNAVGLWQLLWIAPLGLYAEKKKRYWFSRGVWVSAVLLAMLNVLIRTDLLRI
jgi:hypothetical protein